MRKRYSLTVKILSLNNVYEFSKNNLILDAYEKRDVYKREKIEDIFMDEFHFNKIQNFKVVDFECKGLEDVNVSIDNEYLLISSYMYKDENVINYSLFVQSNIIKIVMEDTSYMISYRINIKDSGEEYVYDYIDAIEYEYKEKKINFTISMIHDDDIIAKTSRTIFINDSNLIIDDVSKEIPSYNISNNSVIKDGIENKNLNVDITKTDNSSLFSISVFAVEKVGTQRSIFPSVIANYSTKASYKVAVERFVGRATYNATVNKSSSHVFDVLKWSVGTVYIKFKIEASCRYKDGIYKTSKVSCQFESSIDLNRYTSIDDKNRTIYVDVLKAQTDIAKNKSIKQMLIEAATSNGINNEIVFYNYEIKECTSWSSINNSKCAHATFDVYDGDISINSGPKIIIYPGACVYTGHKMYSFENITSSQRVIDRSMIDSIQIYNQNKDVKSTGSFKIYHIDGDSSYDISNDSATCYPLSTEQISGSIELSESNKSKTISLGTYSKLVTAKVDIVAVTNIHINSKLITKGSRASLDLSSYDDGLRFFSNCYSYYEDELFETEPVVDSCECNGIVSTFDTDLRGKEDSSSVVSPVHVPFYAKEVVVSCNLLSVHPSSASSNTTVSFEYKDNNDKGAIVHMSSNYTTEIASSVKRTFLKTFDGIYLNYNEGRSLKLNVPYNGQGSDNIHVFITSSDQSIQVEYNKTASASNGNIPIDVNLFKTTSKNSKWPVHFDPVYVYKDAIEYFLYNEYIMANTVNGECVLDFIPNDTVNPVCVVHDGNSLTRVISNYKDNISIREIIENSDGVIFTKYNNIVVEKVTFNGYDVPFKFGKNYVEVNQIGPIEIVYKVKDSFDYKFLNGKTYITSTLKNNDLYIYIPNTIKTNIDINPSNTLIDDGHIYIDLKKQVLGKCVVEEYSMPFGYMYYINIYDTYENVFLEEVSINNQKYHNSNVICIKNDNYIEEFMIRSNDVSISVKRKEFVGNA